MNYTKITQSKYVDNVTDLCAENLNKTIDNLVIVENGVLNGNIITSTWVDYTSKISVKSNINNLTVQNQQINLKFNHANGNIRTNGFITIGTTGTTRDELIVTITIPDEIKARMASSSTYTTFNGSCVFDNLSVSESARYIIPQIIVDSNKNISIAFFVSYSNVTSSKTTQKYRKLEKIDIAADTRFYINLDTFLY